MHTLVFNTILDLSITAIVCTSRWLLHTLCSRRRLVNPSGGRCNTFKVFGGMFAAHLARQRLLDELYPILLHLTVGRCAK